MLKYSLIITFLFYILSTVTLGFVVYNDGGLHTIDYTIDDSVRLDAGGSYYLQMRTQLELVEGGEITEALDAYHNSSVTITGGSIGTRWAGYGLGGYDNSKITMSGGTITGWLAVYENSQLYFSGGLIGYSLRAHGNSQVTVSGGMISDYLQPWDNSRLTLSGGIIGNIIFVGFENSLTWPDYDESILTIVGYDFKINGNPVAYGQYFKEDFASGHITGILEKGDILDNDFEIFDGASIILVPESCTLLLLSLGGFLIRKK